VNADQFIVRFQVDVRVRQTARRASIDELAAYTFQSGLVTEEWFFVLESSFKSCNRLAS